MKKCLVTLTLILFSVQLFCQAPDDTISKKGNRQFSEFNLSTSVGFSLSGPLNNIKSTMISSGFDDTSQSFLGNKLIKHPHSRRYFIYDIEGTYYFKEQMGISINVGRADKVEVDGYKGSDPYPQLIGSYMFLESEIKSLSLNYAFRSKNKLHSVFIGPSYIIHHMKNTGRVGFDSPENDNRKVGAYIGYSFQIVRWDFWTIALKANYRWAPKSQIGPFIASDNSEFPATKVNISCLNVGFGVMFRIQNEE